jgi:predicted amidophosphoribosyltransferase
VSGSPAAAAHSQPAPAEVCPLCGAPLRSDQDWCLRCGAAARTRLAAPPKWKGLVLGLAVVAAISLVVLAVALVKLSG